MHTTDVDLGVGLLFVVVIRSVPAMGPAVTWYMPRHLHYNPGAMREGVGCVGGARALDDKCLSHGLNDVCCQTPGIAARRICQSKA